MYHIVSQVINIESQVITIESHVTDDPSGGAKAISVRTNLFGSGLRRNLFSSSFNINLLLAISYTIAGSSGADVGAKVGPADAGCGVGGFTPPLI